MTYLLLPIVITIFSFCNMFSFQFDVCLRGLNYGVRFQNYCHVALIRNYQSQLFLFEDAVEYCISNGGVIDSLLLNRSDTTLSEIFVMAGKGQYSEVNEKMRSFPSSFRRDKDCSRHYTSRPGCEVVCAFKSCPLGTFGFTDCRSKCRCEDDDHCDIITGSCSETGCTFGFFGPPFCRKCNCNRGTQCDTYTGECLLGCKKGWGGKSCQKWTCRSGKCPAFARFARDSSCEIGWTGDGCTTRLCQEGFFGIPDCNETCYCQKPEHCNVVDGGCGGNPCVTGRLGPRCLESAGNFSAGNFSASNFSTGNVSAGNFSAGNSSCPPFRYGQPDCGFYCFCYKSVPCTVTTGLCPGICVPGWTGLHCDTRACHHGFYSYPECTKPCRCAVADACNPLTGVCELETCELWKNCTKVAASQSSEDSHSVTWYLVLTIVIAVAATVLLLLVLCVKKPSRVAGKEIAE